MEMVSKIHVEVNLQIFFSSIYICILGGSCLSCLPLICHHPIGFVLKQVVPVSYYYIIAIDEICFDEFYIYVKWT